MMQRAPKTTVDIAAMVAEQVHMSDSDCDIDNLSDSADSSAASNEDDQDLEQGEPRRRASRVSFNVNNENENEDNNLGLEEGDSTRASRVSFNLTDCVLELPDASEGLLLGGKDDDNQFSKEEVEEAQEDRRDHRRPGPNFLIDEIRSTRRLSNLSHRSFADTNTSNTTTTSNYCKQSSFLRMSHAHKCVDEDILHRAAADAGVGSFGTVYVEVWALNEDGTELFRPDGGYWMDPIFHNPENESGCCGTLRCSACKISNSDHPMFLPADPVAPGVGLAGVLWNESVNVEDTALRRPDTSPRRTGVQRRRSTRSSIFRGRGSEVSATVVGDFSEEPIDRPLQSELPKRYGSLGSLEVNHDDVPRRRSSFFSRPGTQQRRSTGGATTGRRASVFAVAGAAMDVAGETLNAAGGFLEETLGGGEGGVGFFRDTSKNQKKVIWRDLNAMANNPHLPYDERLQAIADSGLGWAAGVPFHVNHHKGIVIYVARKTVDLALLRDKNNEDYLLCASELIGSAFALRVPRRRASTTRRAKRDAAFRRCKLKILTLIRLGAKFDHTPVKVDECTSSNRKTNNTFLGSTDLPFGIKERFSRITKAVRTVAKKCKGSNNKPPPPFSNDQALHTFIGSLSLLVLLAWIGDTLVNAFGHDFLLLMPPFGAFICLQFSLTQAPAAQPRNCLVGQALSISIAMLISLLPAAPTWFKQALGTALAIGAMSRCGVTHPPAGASAFLFASGEFGISHFALLLGANVVAIIFGSVLNNISEKRQYPTYYAMGLNPKDMVEYLRR